MGVTIAYHCINCMLPLPTSSIFFTIFVVGRIHILISNPLWTFHNYGKQLCGKYSAIGRVSVIAWLFFFT